MTSLDIETSLVLHKALLPPGRLIGTVDGVHQLLPDLCVSNVEYLQWCYIKSDRDHVELFHHVANTHFTILQDTIHSLRKSKYRPEASLEIATLQRVKRYNSCVYQYGHKHPEAFDVDTDPHTVWSGLLLHCQQADTEDLKRFQHIYDFNPIVDEPTTEEIQVAPDVEKDAETAWPSEEECKTDPSVVWGYPVTHPEPTPPGDEEDEKYPIRKVYDRSVFQVPEDPKVAELVQLLPVKAEECNKETEESIKRRQEIMARMVNM